MREPGLRRRRARAPGDVADRHFPALRDLPRQKLGLIESAVPSAAPVQRHRDDHIELLLAWNRPGQKIPERPRQGPHAVVFKKMNQLAERALVGPIRISCVKPGKPQPAQRALAVLIERRAIQKRRAARTTKVLGIQWFGVFKAAAANGDPMYFSKGFAAHPAVVGEYQIEQAAKRLYCYASNTVWQDSPVKTTCFAGEQVTREDPPPPNNLSLHEFYIA